MFSFRKKLLVTLITGSVMLTACGDGSERQEKYLERAQENFAAENYEKARIEVKNVLQINPKNAEARLLLGQIEEKEQNWRAAIGNYQAATEADPNNIEARSKLAMFYLAARPIENAAEQAEKIPIRARMMR